MNRHMVKSVTVTIFLGLFLAGAPSHAEDARTLTNLKGETVTIPDLVPDREKLHSLGALTVNVESPIGKGGLIVALYGGATSKRPEDAEYVELYDLTGNLLEIAWFDETGQVKVAHDKNLTDPDAKDPAKVLVMSPDRSFVVRRPSLYHF